MVPILLELQLLSQDLKKESGKASSAEVQPAEEEDSSSKKVAGEKETAADAAANWEICLISEFIFPDYFLHYFYIYDT